jgi:hypothetical protein
MARHSLIWVYKSMENESGAGAPMALHLDYFCITLFSQKIQ